MLSFLAEITARSTAVHFHVADMPLLSRGFPVHTLCRGHVLPFLFLLLTLYSVALGQQCSVSVPCEVGCCSKFGNCGWGEDFCGSGCVASCDAKRECDKDRPCKFGCCSKHGFCGLGGDFCNKDNGNCVAGCDTKSQCDPGWGLQWSNLSSCPLNVCCSKHGFCGTTKDFCGDETVDRPSCPGNSNGIGRVIGYYEGWAVKRPCHSMVPYEIPAGVYTHINFAFGSISPQTFQVIPSSTLDEDLWRKIKTVRYRDVGVKIWLAIGGWTFNDADQPTHMIFSDIAASTGKQDAFFASLVSVMQTYGFDGIDIDWCVTSRVSPMTP